MSDVEVRGSLADLATSWDALVAQRAVPSPFLRSWWLESVAGPHPQFVLVFEDGQLVGGVPLEEDRRFGMSRMQLIGSHNLSADHLDVVAAPGSETTVVDALAGWFDQWGSRLFDLGGLVPSSLINKALPGTVHEEFQAIAPWSPLPPTFDEYLSERPASLRSTLRKRGKRLARAGATYGTLGVDHCDEALRDLRRLHGGRWGAESALLPVFNRFSAAARPGLERGEMRVHVLSVDGTAIAISFCFELAGVVSFYQSGRDLDRRWDGAGTVLKAMVIEYACKEGFRAIDLLRGPETYKRDWADESRPVMRARAAHGLRTRLALSSLLVLRRSGLGPLAQRASGVARRTGQRRGRRDPTPGRHVTTEVRASLGELAPAWDALVDANPRPSPFLCSWWLEAVAAGSGAFVLVFEGDELLGGVSLSADRRRGVRRYRLVTAGIEHDLDLVAAPGHQEEVAGVVRSWLDRRGERIVDLIGVRPDGALAGCAPRSGRVDRLETAPRFQVPPTFDHYLASRRKKLRQEIRRVVRRFDELGARYRVADRDETERALETLERLHRQRWHEHSVFLSNFDRFAAAARAGAARDEVRFHEVEVAGEVIASLVTIERWGCCYFLQMGRNPDRRWSNSGTFLKAKAIERACDVGFRRVDLCYGDPQAKVIWADERQPVARVRWGHGPAGRAVQTALVAIWPAADALSRWCRRARGRETRSTSAD